MEWIALVTVLVLMEYFYLCVLVGKSRGQYNIDAPAISGHPAFERVFRVQQNTLEQLIIFIPALWIFGYYLSPTAGAWLGLAFLLGRILYARGYIQDPSKRGPGFIMGALSVLALLIGGAVGAGLTLF